MYRLALIPSQPTTYHRFLAYDCCELGIGSSFSHRRVVADLYNASVALISFSESIGAT